MEVVVLVRDIENQVLWWSMNRDYWVLHSFIDANTHSKLLLLMIASIDFGYLLFIYGQNRVIFKDL